MRIVSFILAIITVVVGVTFTLLNADTVMVNLYIGEYELPLSMLIVITLGLGILIGFIFFSAVFIKQKAEIYRLRNRMRLVETEVENLRAIPLKDSH